MNSDVSEVKSRLNIVDILGEYIRLDKAGANWRALCPFHNEKTPSFMVNEEKQIWYCFGCQKGGDVFSFVMEMEGVEFREALKNLAEKAGVKLQSFSPQRAEEKNRTLEILELATKFYEIQLWRSEGGKKILQYLHDRGLKDETIKDFRLGYAPKGWKNILAFLGERGYKIKEIMKTGLIVEQQTTCLPDRQTSNKQQGVNFYDRFRDRIIFPVADYSGKILGYSARVAPGGDESQAKYVNTPETEVYHKNRILYGLNKAKGEIKQKDVAILVEGNMDVLAMHQAGMKNVLAVSGTALTENQVEIIKRYTKNIKMFFDMDSAGEAATKKSVKLCLSKDMSVTVVSLPAGKDAADLAKEDLEKLKKAVEKAFLAMDYFFQKTFKKFNKNEIEGKKKIAEELLEIIISLENDVEKSYWIKKLAEELNMVELALLDRLKKINLKSRIEKKVALEKDPVLSRNESRREILEKELIGLMLISSSVWEEALKEAKKGSFLPEDELLSQMISAGEKANFNSDIFMEEIKNDRKALERAEKIFFEKKYQLDLNNNLKEIVPKNISEDWGSCLKEIKKETKKKELSRITADLKLAEKRKDREAVVFLRQECSKISQELSQI